MSSVIRPRPVAMYTHEIGGKTFYQPTYFLDEKPIYLGRYLSEAEAEAVAERGRACKTLDDVQALRAELGIGQKKRRPKPQKGSDKKTKP